MYSVTAPANNSIAIAVYSIVICRVSKPMMSLQTVSDIELLLDTTPSPNTLLRPQFISSGSADEVYPCVWVGNKHAAENIEFLRERGITHVLNCAGGEQSGVESFGHRGEWVVVL